MNIKHVVERRLIITLIVCLILIPVAIWWLRYGSKAAPEKANIVIDSRQIVSPLFFNWQALAQGGEEKGVQMLGNVIPQTRELEPRYIRLDHVYDFYDVVSRDGSGNLNLNFSRLDATVCDIYAAGAKPFFALGYMPPVMSIDGSLIGRPANWNEWSVLVQRTIEHYSGQNTVLCGGAVSGNKLADIYYEVWNEPDLETFGKWSLYGGDKDYKVLYSYSSFGAKSARNVRNFHLGGPGITAAYRNWFQVFLRYVADNNLRIDFLSWHHYTKSPDDFIGDVQNIDDWIPREDFGRFHALPKIITEWGYDSEPNITAHTSVGAAYTVAAARNLIDQKIKLAFSFEVKDGPEPRWGILSYQGAKKPRFFALKMLNLLEGYRLKIDGEGTYVRAIGSISPKKIVIILTNYDQEGNNNELVPITFTNLIPGDYRLAINYLSGRSITAGTIRVAQDGEIKRSVLMAPNNVVALELFRK